jgi:hypothetical protein
VSSSNRHVSMGACRHVLDKDNLSHRHQLSVPDHDRGRGSHAGRLGPHPPQDRHMHRVPSCMLSCPQTLFSCRSLFQNKLADHLHLGAWFLIMTQRGGGVDWHVGETRPSWCSSTLRTVGARTSAMRAPMQPASRASWGWVVAKQLPGHPCEQALLCQLQPWWNCLAELPTGWQLEQHCVWVLQG